MKTEAYIIIIALLASASYIGIKLIVRAYSRYRGTHVVTCPETDRPTVVKVDAIHALLTSAVGPPDIRLEDCWRWPIHGQCGQECLVDLDVAPDECLVSGVLMRWYRGKSCSYCGKQFEELQWIDHRPALLSPEDLLVEWSEVPVENLSTVMKTHRPVCWDCYIAQDFVREHPDLVVYRPGRYDIPGGADGSSASRQSKAV
jgi:hypothetical protein